MIESQPFGRTGHRSSRLIFGAAALAVMRQDRADRVLATVLAAGIDHIDTAAGYGDSELRLAPFLAVHRNAFFVATKTGERTADGARRQLEQSLIRLGIDQVDLIQLHNLVEAEEWEVAHGPGGAVEGLARARDEGLVRFIGVTGHGTRIPDMHRRSLARFDFDSVLIPYNFPLLADPAYRSSVEELLEVCEQRQIAVQAIKSIARRRWPSESTEPHFAWYQPLPEGGALQRGVAYVLANPQLFLNTSSDATLLEATIAAAQGHPATPSVAELEADVAAWEMAPLFDGADLERI